jgi:hypothetical protein
MEASLEKQKGRNALSLVDEGVVAISRGNR